MKGEGAIFTGQSENANPKSKKEKTSTQKVGEKRSLTDMKNS